MAQIRNNIWEHDIPTSGPFRSSVRRPHNRHPPLPPRRKPPPGTGQMVPRTPPRHLRVRFPQRQRLSARAPPHGAPTWRLCLRVCSAICARARCIRLWGEEEAGAGRAWNFGRAALFRFEGEGVGSENEVFGLLDCISLFAYCGVGWKLGRTICRCGFVLFLIAWSARSWSRNTSPPPYGPAQVAIQLCAGVQKAGGDSGAETGDLIDEGGGFVGRD